MTKHIPGEQTKMTTPARSFTDLIVWQKAHAFVLSIYELSRDFPKTEVFGLTSQLRRAAVSVPANIAEGFRKQTRLDKARYLNTAEGSLEECRYYLILAHDLGYIDKTTVWEQSDEVGRLLNGYRTAVMNNQRSLS